ncbi:hypothetical protein COSO111634_38475 [Corallococcus soli]
MKEPRSWVREPGPVCVPPGLRYRKRSSKQFTEMSVMLTEHDAARQGTRERMGALFKRNSSPAPVVTGGG